MVAVRRARMLTLGAALACICASSEARAADVPTDNPHLLKARAELDDLHYDAARSALDQALATGDNDPAELADIYRLSAQVAAALGDDAAATGHFARLLTLDPEYTLPIGTSPKIAEPLTAARNSLGGKALMARYVVDSAGPTVEVRIDSDPLGMVVGVRVDFRADGGEADKVSASGQPPYSVTLPSGATHIEFTVAVLDEHGNHLVEFGSKASPLVIDGEVEPPPPIVKPGGRKRPLYARWWLWGGVAAAAAGAGTYFGLDVLDAQDDIEALNRKSVEMPPVDFSEAQAVEQRGKRSALVANISFGVAGAAALVAIVCVVTGGDEKPERTDRTMLVPTLGGDGVGVMVISPF